MKDLVENTGVLMGKDVAVLVLGNQACSDVQQMLVETLMRLHLLFLAEKQKVELSATRTPLSFDDRS
ncbi:hypothetical protein DY000_02062758 [Brassica cretica]|uniref:Uncharacterized protein n=1 Tax=Brassica cretica TaxID=69181 RepID=A0ABQ7AYZ5_BRACR|nr:hypothetical protein DY000_02062758 [Brassica cretica]